MARIDQHTGKKAMVGNNRSHALNATKRKWNLNLQKTKIKTSEGTKKIKVSARTLKTLKKQQKISN